MRKKNNNLPSSMPSGIVPSTTGTNYAVATEPPKKSKAAGKKTVFPISYSAGGGLLVGVLAGFLLISGGDSAEATTSSESEKEAVKVIAEGPPKASVNIIPALDASPAGVKPEEIEEVKEEVPAPTAQADDVKNTIVNIDFDISPSEIVDQVVVEVDGEQVGTGPFAVEFKTGKKSQKVHIVANAKGYKKFRTTLLIQKDKTIPIKMRLKPVMTKATRNARSGGSPVKSGRSKNSPNNKRPGGLLSL